MNKLLLYPGEFSPVTNSELAYAKRVGKLLSSPVVFLPFKEASSASFDERIDLLSSSIGSENPTLKIDKSLFDMSLEEYLKKHNEEDIHLLVSPDNEKPLEEVFVNCASLKTIKPEEAGVSFLSSEEDNRTLRYIELSKEALKLIHEKKLYYVQKVASYLTDKRLRHSESVALLSYEIALSNNLSNPGRAYIAGLLHDIGKYVKDEEGKALLEKEGVKEAISCPNWAYHQFVGAIYAERDFHIDDDEILFAIRYHCSGNATMPPLAQIIYSADKIDPLRGWDSASYIEECKKDYEKGFISVLRANREFLHEKAGEEADKCLLSQECYEAYL